MNTIIRITTLFTFIFFTTGNAFAYGGYGRHGYSAFNFCSLIVLFGVTALIGLIITLALGYKKSGSRKTALVWHKNLAVTTIVVTVLHVALALFSH